jgi:hypothetical protein
MGDRFPDGDGAETSAMIWSMIVHLLRRIRFAWLWAVAMLIWRNRATITRTLRTLYFRIRGVEPPPRVTSQPIDV